MEKKNKSNVINALVEIITKELKSGDTVIDVTNAFSKQAEENELIKEKNKLKWSICKILVWREGVQIDLKAKRNIDLPEEYKLASKDILLIAEEMVAEGDTGLKKQQEIQRLIEKWLKIHG